MRKLMLFLTVFFILFSDLPAFSDESPTAVYKVGNLTITSYSPCWNEPMLKSLYLELLSNFHGSEFDNLSDILIYPDSPDGVNGYYYEDINISGGRYILGNNARIKLFNANRYNSVQKISPYLAHEYGHHYTISNMITHEGKHYTDWLYSEYSKLRNLSQYPVVYSNFSDSVYCWNITEIAASDYVQLLGSSTAKASMDYSDTLDDFSRGNYSPYYTPTAFNSFPQLNQFIPLAANVDGLYEYFINLSGFSSSMQPLEKIPVLSDVNETITSDNKKQYSISWTPAQGEGSFEYTLIMYPKTLPTNIVPIRTVSDGEELKAVFGTVTRSDSDGIMRTAYRSYDGEYEIKLYTKNSHGFIFESAPISYTFVPVENNSDTLDKPTEQTAEKTPEIKNIIAPDITRTHIDSFNNFISILPYTAIS